MIISEINPVRVSDIQKYVWPRINQFQNIEYTTDLICRLHFISANDKSNRKNAENQAEQIKYCLSQAKEYFDAAVTVSLATKPVLLYYSTMSMALAEILLKQDGNSRLSKLREQHNCHGLQLSVPISPRPEDNLMQAASRLIAKAQKDISDKPKGTFEMWRRSAREYPAGGMHTTFFPENKAQQQQYQVILTASDEPPPHLPKAGLSLLECLCELPYLQDLLRSLGVPDRIVHAKLISYQTGAIGDAVKQLVVHPHDGLLLQKFGSCVKMSPDAVNILSFQELPDGYIMSWPQSTAPAKSFIFPTSICMNKESVYFSCSGLNLGEFGFLYAALHICGNFARYYPDIWLKHIEKSSALSMAVDELCAHALDRLPLLTLSELRRKYHVIDN